MSDLCDLRQYSGGLHEMSARTADIESPYQLPKSEVGKIGAVASKHTKNSINNVGQN